MFVKKSILQIALIICARSENGPCKGLNMKSLKLHGQNQCFLFYRGYFHILNKLRRYDHFLFYSVFIGVIFSLSVCFVKKIRRYVYNNY